MITKSDFIVIAFALSLLPFLYLSYWGNSAEGDTALIQAGGHDPIEVSLHKDQRINIAGRLGDSIIEIHDGMIRFVASPCSGKQCVHSGWLHHDGAFAACLPNRISVAVLGQTPRFDSINF